MADWLGGQTTQAGAQQAQARGASVLDRDITVTGSIASSGSVRIDGRVEGDVKARTLTLTQNASIKGGVEAELAVIEGTLTGTLRAREVRLAATARVQADIFHGSLTVESGAQFEGASRREPSPAASAVPV